jgi:hypothetical protein
MADDFDPYYQWLGIPKKFQPPNHYRLLAIEEFEDNPDVIENAADRQMAHVRLFQSGPNGEVSQKLLNEITAAKLCLLNKEKKTQYDEKLRAEKATAEAAARPPSPPRAVRGERAVRNVQGAEPVPLGSAAADVDPLLSPAPGALRDDAAETPGASLSLTPGRRRRLSASSGRVTAQQAAIAGSLIGVVILAIVMYFIFKRGGGATASNDPRAQQATVDPPIEPIKRRDDPVEPKETIGKKKKTPATKPKATPTSPLEGVQQVLRLYDRDYVELAGTADRNDAPVCAEMWLRLNPKNPQTCLFGNLATAAGQPEQSSGWALTYWAQVQVADGTEPDSKEQAGGVRAGGARAGLVLQVGSIKHLGERSEMDNDWHHVALCIEPGMTENAYRVFLDGKQVAFTRIAAAEGRSSHNLFLGSPPRMSPDSGLRTDMAVLSFRLSSTARYQGGFTPGKLTGDQQTAALLDLSVPQGTRVADSTGGRHDGRIVGGRWVRVEYALAAVGTAKPASKPTAKPPKTANAMFLDDLPEEEFKVGLGTLGKRGKTGHENPVDVSYQGRRILHALAMHGAPSATVHVTYQLGEGFRTFQGIAAILDVPGQSESQSPLTFRVFGDEKRLWESGPLQRCGTGETFAVSIQGVKTLKLEVYCPGGHAFAHAAWLSPRIVKVASSKPSVPAKEPVAAKPPTRLPVPATQALETARRQVKESFTKEYEEATTPGSKAELAQKLMSRADGGNLAVADKYALLDEARELLVSAGEVELVLLVNEQLVAGFEVKAAEQAVAVLSRLAAGNLANDKRKALVEATLEATDEAAGAEDFKAAAELAALAQKTGAKLSDLELRSRCTKLHARIEQCRIWSEEAEKARPILTDKPDDGPANTALGKYLCFAVGDWEKGLPYLAKSSEAKLKATADLELSQPSLSEKQAATGDAWWDLASTATGQSKLVLQKRAQHWYAKAVEALKGPAKATVEKRLATLEKVVGDSAGGSGKTGIAKQIVGNFYLTATAKKGGAVTNTTLGFADNGTFSENQLPVGKWKIEAGQVRLTFDEADRGTVRLRSRGKDAFVGQQTLGNGDVVNWELKLVTVVATWEVFSERDKTEKPARLVLYSNFKGNDPYGPTTWSLSGNALTLDWRDFPVRGGFTRLQANVRVSPDGKTFAGQDNRRFELRGKRVAGGGAGGAG